MLFTDRLVLWGVALIKFGCLMFMSDLLIWWILGIWTDPVLQLFYSWALIKTIFTQFIITSCQPVQTFSRLSLAGALYLLSAPGRSSPEQHPRSQSAVSGRQSSEQTGRKFVFDLSSSLQSQSCEAEHCSNPQSVISNGTRSVEISKKYQICQAENEGNV